MEINELDRKLTDILTSFWSVTRVEYEEKLSNPLTFNDLDEFAEHVIELIQTYKENIVKYLKSNNYD